MAMRWGGTELLFFHQTPNVAASSGLVPLKVLFTLLTKNHLLHSTSDYGSFTVRLSEVLGPRI